MRNNLRHKFDTKKVLFPIKNPEAAGKFVEVRKTHTPKPMKRYYLPPVNSQPASKNVSINDQLEEMTHASLRTGWF